MLIVADSYAQGIGVAKQLKTAVTWYLAAAEVDVPESERDWSFEPKHVLIAKAAAIFEEGGPGFPRDMVHAGTCCNPCVCDLQPFFVVTIP